MSKAQVQQLFVLIGAMMVIGVIVLFGLKSVSTVEEKGDATSMLLFKNRLSKDVEGMSYEMGSVDVVKYPLPSGYSEICIVDLEKVNVTNLFDYPQIRSYIISGAEKNVFFFSNDGFHADFISDLGVLSYPYFSCIDRKGAIEISIEGGEGKGKVRLPPKKEHCENAAANSPWGCLVLDYTFGEGYKEDCKEDYGFC